MTTFKSHSEAQRKAESITDKIIHFSNNGLEIILTSNESLEADEIKNQLKKIFKKIFSDVRIYGRTYKTIKINYISENVQRGRITEVAY
jgi:uncharacterized protein YaaN involved in tellurite resistance